MRKLMLLAVAFALTLGALARAGEVEIRFSWWGGDERHQNTLKVIELFEKANPGVKVKAEYMGWNGYVERLTTQIGAGSEPDVMQINWAWIDMFSRDGSGLYDLNKVKDHLNLGDFTQDMIDSGLSNGVLNGLPISMTTRFFIWNKTMWDKAGVPMPKTWDELLAAGPKFKALSAENYAMDLEPIEGLYMVNAWVYEKYGQQIIHNAEPRVGLTVEQLTDGLNFFKQCFDSHTAVSAPIRTSIAGQYERPAEQVSAYVDGLWAGTFVWNSMFKLRTKGPEEKGFDMVLGPMLTADGKNAKPDRIGRPAMMLAIGKNTKHPEIAAQFVAFFLTNPEAAKALKLARGLPVSKTAYETLVKENLISPMDLEGQDQLDGARIVYTSPLFEHERIRSYLLEVLEGVSHNKYTPAEAAQMIEDECNKRIRRIVR